MIIDTKESTLETYGDIEEIQTSINKEDLDFIITLLSSNQYSMPERSFLREITSNAWDAHVAANNTDQPIIVILKMDSITVRDYGIGLSKEEFENLYCKIGSSTKRNSNAYIGAFGLGHLSPLAVSDTVDIIDYYNGTAYHYIMIKDGNKITTTLVDSEQTDEHNGLEITVEHHNLARFQKDLYSLCFFPNVYLETSEWASKSYCDALNASKIKKYNNYWVNDNYNTDNILLGCVQYPLKTTIISDPILRKFCDQIDFSGVSIKFEIGELDVTPNREEIIYTDKSVEIINNRVREAYNEMMGNIEQITDKNFDKIQDLYKAIYSGLRYDPFNNLLNGHGKSVYIDTTDEHIKYKYKGKFVGFDSNIRYQLQYVFRSSSVKSYYYNDKFYSAPLKSSPTLYYLCNAKFLIVKGRMDQYKKEYIKDNYRLPHIIIEDKSVFDEFYLNVKDYIPKEIYDSFVADVDIEELNIPKPPKGEKVKVIKSSYTIHRYNGYIWKTQEIDDIKSYIENNYRKHGIVVMNKSEQSKELAEIIWKIGYIPIWAAKDTVNIIKQSDCTQIMDLQKFFKKRGRSVYFSIKFGNNDDALYMYRLIPNMQLPNLYTTERFDVTPYIEEDIIKDADLIQKYINAYKEAYREYYNTNGCDEVRPNSPLLLKYVMAKRSKLRIRWEYLEKILNDNLVKVCRN